MNLRTRGEGVKKSEIFADVLNGSPLTRSLRPLINETPTVKGSEVPRTHLSALPSVSCPPGQVAEYHKNTYIEPSAHFHS